MDIQQVDISFFSGHRATIANVYALVHDDRTGTIDVLQATGEAIRSMEDKKNDDIGVSLAVGRALQTLGKKIERRGHGLVKHASDMKEKEDERSAVQPPHNAV